MHELLQDIRYGWRALHRAAGFSLTVIITLAVGIGATVAIFAVVNAMLLRPLPYPESDRMVMVWQDMTQRGGPEREWFTPPDFVDLREQTRSFAALSAVGNWRPALMTGDGAESVGGAIVSSGWFDVVGVQPFIGAAFRAETERPGADPEVVLGYDLWQRVFGGDPAIVGGTVRLNDVAHRVAGVMPQGFSDPLFDAEIWRSRVVDAAGPCGRGCFTIRVIGRLAPEVTTAAATADAGALAARLAQEYATNRDVTFAVVGLRDDLLAGTRPALIALAVAVTLLLLMAIVNVANLLIARAGVRQRDLAIRTALGAGRGVIVRQMLIETALLGVFGALAGAVVSLWALDLLTALAPEGTPRIEEVRIDAAALLFALITAAFTTIAAGLGPALHAVRGGIADVIRDAGGLRTSRSRQRARSTLVVAQIAITLTLLIGSGLTLKSLARLQSVDPGFDPDGVVTGTYQLPPARYATDEQVRAFMATAIERVGAVPGVTGVGTTSSLPMTEGDSDIDFVIEGRTLAVDEQPPASWFRMVSPSYFDVMEMRIIDGRGFTTADRAGDGVPFAIVVNEEFQRRHFPDGAVGGRLRFGERSAEIVGVVADTRHRGLGEEAVTEMFLSAEQVGNRSVTFVVRSPLDAAAAGAAVRDALRAIDPALPPPPFITMEHLVAQTIALPRLYSAFFAFFAAVALLLAAVGVYGLTAYAVGQRRQEIGIRVALGARSADVVGMVVRRSMTLTIAGIVIGLIAAFALARPLAVLLFDMSAHDIATFAAVPAILAVITLAASWIPARGAARVDPLEALRRD